MIRPATKAIAARFQEDNLKYTIHEIDDASILEAAITLESFSYNLVFISSDDDTDAEAYAKLLHVPEDKQQAILPVLNQINCDYRYFTFYLDEDSDVHAKFTFPLSTPIENVGEFAYEMTMRSGSIFEDVYPRLMKAIWA